MDHASVTPRRFSYDLLNEITDGFSEERKLGNGTYGIVYKGVQKDGGTIAVKLLYDMPGLDDKQFRTELNNLMCLQHHNIVRLVGYCDDAQPQFVEYEGRMVVADKIYRALCFDYAHNGSLHEHLSDEYNGPDWRTRFGIIEGICNGLKYLHHELQPPMYHLDLKPANVLLDENMLPWIADFGLSRLFGQEQTKITISSMGTLGYLPPEYIEQHVLSNKFDIFSLGVVIIKVMAGSTGYSKCAEMSSQEFVELVHGSWRARLQALPMCEPEPEVYYEQVKTCIEIALRCVEVNRHKRPSIRDIVDKMNETRTKIRLWSPLSHIDSLSLWVHQSKAKAENNQLMVSSENENSCQLCKVQKLTFEPSMIYCSPCGARIKINAPYYTVGTGDTRPFICIPCYHESRGNTIEVEEQNFPKARFEKKRNDEETEELWVQCNICECWQHQICALFNGIRNDGGRAEYTCPYCYIKEVERGFHMPLPRSAVLGASDLPRTVLSDHIEERLVKQLKLDRQARASRSGRNFNEVAGAEGLVVRVVSSVDKKVDVKPSFLEFFQDDNYPTEFPYKSKAVLLFQKIEGVEVCLFGMYVQEFGAECAYPNQRLVYLSYLDSVKYFRPEIKAASGEALCKFVYHEILIGYLEYCKQRGFTSCYIWACPPLAGEESILYCNPETQKTPKYDKLRQWYLAMIRKAAEEEIVVELTNLYDHFFINMGECKAKVTASRLPYFDGDYWPGAAEDMINQLRQDEDDRRLQKKRKASGNASKDAMLMEKYSCRHCCIVMSSGKRWVCHQCRSFYICDKCYSTERQLKARERHPSNRRDTHKLHPVDIVGVPDDTKDRDDILESEFFDTRQAFLSLCQGNHYQYDTLRRAKHSSMMVLYHLHNPTVPAFVPTCDVCAHDIETGQGWGCKVCPDFDVCNGCYQKGAVNHPHKLTNHPSAADHDAQNKEARQMRVSQLRKMLGLVVHASPCRSSSCQYPNCRKVKGLFRHGMQCKTRAIGGCALCKKMWYMLQLHARACIDSGCRVPRCRCYSTEQQLEDTERHLSNSRDTHKLHPVDIVGIHDDTKVRDDILESEFFDTRQAFLSLCQGNRYQYDTLRRAKHSSMMVLYHLHNPTAPPLFTTCNVCAHDIETGQGLRCEVCPDFDVCNGCYRKGTVNHPHKLTNHPSAADGDAQNKEARQMRVSQLRKMLDHLVHASTCPSSSCQYPNCGKVKGLYQHGMQCKTRASGGCALCKKMWYILQLHARACRDSGCSVPRCRDLKEHLRRLQQQYDSRRRAAVNEMMKQRAAEVAAT